MGMDGDSSEDEDTEGLQTCRFTKNPHKYMRLYSTCKPNRLFGKLIRYLKEKEYLTTVSDKHYKFDFQRTKGPAKIVADKNDQQEEQEEEDLKEPFQGRVELQQVNDTTVCIDFTLIGGSSRAFCETFNFLKANLRPFFNAFIV